MGVTGLNLGTSKGQYSEILIFLPPGLLATGILYPLLESLILACDGPYSLGCCLRAPSPTGAVFQRCWERGHHEHKHRGYWVSFIPSRSLASSHSLSPWREAGLFSLSPSKSPPRHSEVASAQKPGRGEWGQLSTPRAHRRSDRCPPQSSSLCPLPNLRHENKDDVAQVKNTQLLCVAGMYHMAETYTEVLTLGPLLFQQKGHLRAQRQWSVDPKKADFKQEAE